MVQIGSTALPIIVTPRINGNIVTQTQIKNDFSNEYVSDIATPLAFTLEYKKIGGTVLTQAWDESKSTPSTIFFAVPDSLYVAKAEWTVAVYWTIDTEKIYVLKPFHLTVDDVHNQ